MTPVPTTFPTLRSAEYRECQHPRVLNARCCDCGAYSTPAGWMGGSLDYPREPWRLQ